MIAVIGEALIDLIGSNSDEYRAVVGGANANVALALAVRGEGHLFLGRISSDSFGQRIRSHLSSNGVDLSLSISAKEQSSLAVATLDQSGVASYSFYVTNTADWGWQREELPRIEALQKLGVKAIQYGCLSMAIEPGNKVIEQWLSEIHASDSITLSHDLNIRPALGFDREVERERVENLNSISHLIKASDADIEWLYGLAPGSNLDEIAGNWSAGKLVIITRGASGVSLYRDGHRTDVSGFAVELVDTIGAGDTFIANFLGELSSLDAIGANPQEKLINVSTDELIRASKLANAAAAIVCERVGCQPPTKQQSLSRFGD